VHSFLVLCVSSMFSMCLSPVCLSLTLSLCLPLCSSLTQSPSLPFSLPLSLSLFFSSLTRSLSLSLFLSLSGHPHLTGWSFCAVGWRRGRSWPAAATVPGDEKMNKSCGSSVLCFVLMLAHIWRVPSRRNGMRWRYVRCNTGRLWLSFD
jgi:hypothetical protein